MSKITNDGLTRSGIRCFIAKPIQQQWASKGWRSLDKSLQPIYWRVQNTQLPLSTNYLILTKQNLITSKNNTKT